MAKTKKTAKPTKKSQDFKIDLSTAGIKNFITLAKGFRVSTISLGEKGKKITIHQRPAAAPVQKEPVIEKVEYKPESFEKIKSRFIGTFHSAKGAEAGKEVKKGQVVAKISSMKIEHEIKAEKDCKISKVLVKEKEAVDYGKPLFFIE